MAITFLKSATKLEELPNDTKPQIAFVGRSNVGKSSLLNHLTGQKDLARVSAEPGRTQTINLFNVDGRYYLVDLPGYGFAKTSKAKRQDFAGMLRDYLWQAQQLRLVLLMIDARVGPTDLDRDMLAYLDSGKIPVVLIVNKIDKLSNSESINLQRMLESQYPQISFIPHSNVTGKGRGEILDVIEQMVRSAK
ncbi:YihA family ribosome biogenesis GTP-binding protein [Patescibacteria group bacterium]|nr:YihA family ribosome biogenesis GTP-binding protein [Patescibacteria group bacterium]MBP9710598.1 YihA family ribosome biogenesis GTP-binding protein [Patescibacteria group bacterium]